MEAAIDRIYKFINHLGISVNEFSNKIGVSNGYLAKQRSASANIGSHIIEKIVISYPDISLLWLITGKGDMLIADKEENSEQENKENIHLASDETHYYKSIAEGEIGYGKRMAKIDPDFEKITRKDVEILQKVIENQFEELAELHAHITTLLNIISTLSKNQQNNNSINEITDEKVKNETKEISAIALK